MERVAGAFYLVALGVFGLIFGSFSNVVIWRLPRGGSVVTPGSHCPGCGRPIRSYDNIPLVSWVVLRARCRDCGARIHWRYPVVEALSGALWVLAGLAYGPAPRAAFGIALFALLLVLAFIDLDTMRLPNVLVAGVAGVGVLGALLAELTGIDALPLTGVPAEGWLAHPLAAAAFGALLGGGFTLMLSLGYRRMRGRAGMGMGDVKLIAAAGLFLGPYVLLALFAGSFLGLGGALLSLRGAERGTFARARIPFGPYLAAGIVIAALTGPALMNGYLSLIGLR